MKPVAFLLGTILAASTFTAHAEREHNRSLGLEECIRIALAHNYDIQITSLDPQLASFTLSASYGSYDPTLSFGASHDYSLSPGGRDANNIVYAGAESESDNLNAALNGLLPWGLNYSLGVRMSDRYGDQPGVVADQSNLLGFRSTPVYDSAGSTNNIIGYMNEPIYAATTTRFPFENTSGNVGVFTMRQPLLKNFWIDSPRLQIFLNKKNLKISELGLRNQIITSVTEVEAAYYNLMYAEENVKVQEKALELAERLVAENRRRVEVGALAPLDEKQAESQAAASRANLLDAQANRETAERVLKSLLSDDYNDWMDVRIEPAEALLALPQTLNLQESWRKGLVQRPDLLQARINVEKQTKTVSYAKNQLYPQLDLVGDFGYSASSGSVDGGEFSDALGQISGRDNPFYSYGVSVSIPLANTSARNSYKSAKVTKEQLELQLRKLEQGILITIENAMANARISFERVSVTHQATQYAEDALKAEQTKLEKGKSTSFVVLQLQSNLTAARSAEIRALADYNIALARLAQNEGSTLERRNIELSVK
jgi:outer membrane protein TolC